MAGVFLLTNALVQGSHTRKNVFPCTVSGSSKGQLLPKGWGDMGIPRGPARQGVPQPGSVPPPPVREVGRLGGQPRAAPSPGHRAAPWGWGWAEARLRCQSAGGGQYQAW